MEVLVFKLVNGDEIIARAAPSAENLGDWKLSKPLSILMAPRQDGSGVGIGLMPYIAGAGSDAEVVLRDASMILRPYKPVEFLEKNYIQATTGIQLEL